MTIQKSCPERSVSGKRRWHEQPGLKNHRDVKALARWPTAAAAFHAFGVALNNWMKQIKRSKTSAKDSTRKYFIFKVVVYSPKVANQAA